jgi:hypothetical protein
MSSRTSNRGRIAWGLVVLLAILHYDFWYWDDETLVFGFVPIGLAFHAVFSLAAAGVWALVMLWSWPTHVEKWAAQSAEREETSS